MIHDVALPPFVVVVKARREGETVQEHQRMKKLDLSS